MTNTIKRKNSGFTIVELLIVIVVIAILAAISIVAYNGIQNRSKASAALSAAQTAAKKAEVYAADGPTSAYPLTHDALSTAPSTAADTWFLTGVTVVNDPSAFTAGSPPGSPSEVRFRKCGGGATQALITAANITGVEYVYYNYADSGATAKTVKSGSGTCPTS